ARAIFADDLVRKRTVDKRHADQIILCRFDRFFDRIRHFFCLSGTETDVSGFVTDYDQRRERHIFAAFYDLRNAVDRNKLIFEQQSVRRNSLIILHLYFLSSALSLPFRSYSILPRA